MSVSAMTEKPKPTIYVADYTPAGKDRPHNAVITVETRADIESAGAAEITRHEPLIDAIRAGDESVDVQVVLFDTLEEAQACVYGFSFGDWDRRGWFAARMEGYSIAVLFEVGGDQGDLRYLDRRGGKMETARDVESEIDG